MQAVNAILFDPVGALAEFPAAPFQAVAARVFARSPTAQASAGGSAGSSIAARIAMIAITTNSSIKVKPAGFRLGMSQW